MLTQACAQFASAKSTPGTCVRCGWPIDGHGASAPAARPVRTAKIWADTVRHETCRSARCGKPIYFAQNIRTGTFMPFDGRPVVIAKESELETGREIWLVDLAHSHFASCVSAKAYRRRA